MAPRHHTTANKKGQALLETTVLLGTTGMCLYFLLRLLLQIIFTIALDAMVEDYFFCELAERPSCVTVLENKLRDNQIREVKISKKELKNKITLHVSGRHLTIVNISREFDYEKFRRKF